MEERKWVLGDDLAACDNLLDGITFEDVILAVHCNCHVISRETVTVTGNLCTGTDLVLSDADMPKMEVGDTVVFPNAGSYAAVISPMQFASQPKPAQLFLRADGTVVNTDF